MGDSQDGETLETVIEILDGEAEEQQDEENTRKRKRDDNLPESKRLKVEVCSTPEAVVVDKKVTAILMNSKNKRSKIKDLEAKLSPKMWIKFHTKHELELKELLELFGTKYTFEIQEGETSVVLNPQGFGYGRPAVFPPMMQQMMAAGAPQVPGGAFGMPPFPPGAFFGGQPGAAGGKKNGNPKQTFFCEVCQLPLSSMIVRTAHYQGKRHLKNVAKMQNVSQPAPPSSQAGGNGNIFPTAVPFKPSTPHPDIFYPYECFLCNVAITSKKAEDLHVNGKKHQRKASEKQQGGFCPVATTTKKKPASNKPQKDGFIPSRCEYCAVDLSSTKMAEAHRQGKKHQKRVAMANGGGAAMLNKKTTSAAKTL